MRVHLCGVRGSTPTPGHDFADIGGHTSCVALVPAGGARPTLVLDAGTGLRSVTGLLGAAVFQGSILLSHLHWDHTQGLPFFRSGDQPGSRVRLLLPEQSGPPDALLGRWMGPPFFPIDVSGLRGHWELGLLAEGRHRIERFDILALEIPHKGGRTFGFRIAEGTTSIAYLPDHAPYAFGPGHDGWGEYHAAACELAAGVDLLLHDAQHTADELPAVAGYGHSAAEYAAALGARCGAKRVLLFHHDPDRTDAAVRRVAAAAAARVSVPVEPAVEGTVFDLPA